MQLVQVNYCHYWAEKYQAHGVWRMCIICLMNTDIMYRTRWCVRLSKCEFCYWPINWWQWSRKCCLQLMAVWYITRCHKCENFVFLLPDYTSILRYLHKEIIHVGKPHYRLRLEQWKLASISADHYRNINILQAMQIFSVTGKNVKSCNNCNCFDMVKIGNIFVNKEMLMWHWVTWWWWCHDCRRGHWNWQCRKYIWRRAICW